MWKMLWRCQECKGERVVEDDAGVKGVESLKGAEGAEGAEGEEAASILGEIT